MHVTLRNFGSGRETVKVEYPLIINRRTAPDPVGRPGFHHPSYYPVSLVLPTALTPMVTRQLERQVTYFDKYGYDDPGVSYRFRVETPKWVLKECWIEHTNYPTLTTHQEMIITIQFNIAELMVDYLGAARAVSG